MSRGSDLAIVHERFTEPGGSEKVVERFHEIWPEATVYAPIVDPAAVPGGLRAGGVRCTWLQRLYRGGHGYAHLLPLIPLAMRTMDLGEARVVLASHHAFANRVRPPAGAKLVSYTYTPARWMWDPKMRANEVGGRVGNAVLAGFSATQRKSDAAAARRADLLVVISRHVRERVRRWWGLDSSVVCPPADVGYFTPDPGVEREDFFLLAGRLVPYKRPEVAVAAAARAGVRLVVAGDGRSRPAVEAAAGPGTEVLGAVDDRTLRQLFRSCKALVNPGEEDFGLVPVEAQACGAPVVGLRAGGLLDSVLDGVTGSLYEEGGDGVAALAEALARFDPSRFDPVRARRNAERFSPASFREQMTAVVESVAAGEAPPTLLRGGVAAGGTGGCGA